MAINMELKLFGPGMTSLHKAGLAGLFMTLRSFEERNRKIDGLSWELLPDKVRLCWQKENRMKPSMNWSGNHSRLIRMVFPLSGA